MTVQFSAFIATSLDGFIARNDGAIDWLPVPGPDDPEDYGYHDFMASVDCLVMGRKTFDTVRDFEPWPYPGHRVVVLSRTLTAPPDSLRDSVEVFQGSPGEVEEKLAREGVRRAYLDGGETIQDFLRAGLLHEIILTRIPVLLGSGRPLFGTVDHDVPLEHVSTSSHPNGFVQSHYRISGSRRE